MALFVLKPSVSDLCILIVSDVPFIDVLWDCVTLDPCAAPDRPVEYQYFRHTDPAKYVQCTAGNVCTTMDCVPGLIYDMSIEGCNWPDLVT